MNKKENLWDNLRQGFKDGLQYTVQKTEELTRIGRLKLDIVSEKRKMEKSFAELGRLVFEQHHDSNENTLWVDVAMQDEMQNLRTLERKLHRLEDQLEVATRHHEDDADEDPVDVQDPDTDDDPEDFIDQDESGTKGTRRPGTDASPDDDEEIHRQDPNRPLI